uniref:WRKY33-1_1 n=1 Tax=Reaumuria trigyna TaxID=1091135 RepID=U5YD90_9CARY|nr:WRKY33-1_1 [Reaumuria trigyna]
MGTHELFLTSSHIKMPSSVAGLDNTNNLSPTSAFFNFPMSSSPFTDFFASSNENTTGDVKQEAFPGNWAFLDNMNGGGDDGEGAAGMPRFKSLAPPQLPFSTTVSPFSAAADTSGGGATTPGAAFSPSMFLDSPIFFPGSNNSPSPTVGALLAAGDNFNWPGSGSNNNPTSNNHQQQQEEETNREQEKNNNNQNCDFSFQSQSIPTANSYNTTNPAALQPNNQKTSQPHYLRTSKQSEDGYNWRKYGQKQVKGSENPRSYYKCSYPNCPTKKKVETSLIDGSITEIVYRGSHNHPKPLPRKSSSSICEISSDVVPSTSAYDNVLQMVEHYSTPNITPETSSVSLDDDDFDQSSAMSNPAGKDEDMEPESKRWKGETETEANSAYGSRAVREPRVVVQTTSEIDIFDDGYRWRKYGQKVVKGNPNPRSYYKCTSVGCPVRKHIERACHDLRAVITTYEGKHNHDVPAARGSSYNSFNRPTPNNDNNTNMPVRPSPISHQSNATTNAFLPNQSQPYPLQMIQGTGTGSYGFSSGYGNPFGTFMNQTQQQQQQNEVLYLTAKEEQTDNPFLEALLH